MLTVEEATAKMMASNSERDIEEVRAFLRKIGCPEKHAPKSERVYRDYFEIKLPFKRKLEIEIDNRLTLETRVRAIYFRFVLFKEVLDNDPECKLFHATKQYTKKFTWQI